MHTIKVELTLAQCDELEEQLLLIANDLGKPLNFSLLRIEEKKRAMLTGYFKNKAEAAKQLAMLTLPAPVHHGFLRDRDWQDSVRKHFKPFAYRNVIWAPVWATPADIAKFEKTLPKLPSVGKKPAAKRKVLKLDPGMAFGTGNHPTTKLCLRRVVEAMDFYGKGSTILDIGCGSGILAITAEKMGAKWARGFDLDEHSIVVAKRNQKINNSKATFAVGDVYADKLPQADIVLANLLANLITDNAKKLWAATNVGGTLILSGLLKHELPTIAALFPQPAIHYTLGKWGALAIIKPE